MEAQAQTGDILTLLRQHGVRFMDKRGNGGALWLIGGNELKPIIAEASDLALRFTSKRMAERQQKVLQDGGESKIYCFSILPHLSLKNPHISRPFRRNL